MRKILLQLCIAVLLLLPAAAGDFTITLDYRFDKGYFSDHPERKIPLEYAASLWEGVLTSPVLIPAELEIDLRGDYTRPGYTTVTFDLDVESFVIFVYAFDFSREVEADGTADPSTSKAFGGNFGKDFSFGYMAFNSNADRDWFFDPTPETEYDVPVRDSYDMITSAVHEMGHILGILRGRQERFVSVYGDADERFDGTASRRVNNGDPIPLEYDSSHIRGEWWNADYLPLPPIDRHVMHTHDPVQGYRQVMTAVDLAILDDIGWDVNYENLPEYPYTPVPDPRKENAERYFGIEEGTLNPSGLWVFDNLKSVEDAIIGQPLRYYPAPGQTGGLPDLIIPGGIEVPRGGWLFCVPGLSPTGGGEDCNDYTLVFDIRISSYDRYYTLFNTNPFSGNDGESFINSDGYFGAGSGGYSSQRIPLNRWIRLAIVVDSGSGSRSYYIDGGYSHTVNDVSIDGSYAIYPKNSSLPFFCLFGDDDGEDNPIDVKRVVLYDRALDGAAMDRLGGSENADFGLYQPLH